jgi:hypothetical protein
MAIILSMITTTATTLQQHKNTGSVQACHNLFKEKFHEFPLK